MTSRERIIASIEHREPDRVPVDLGGSIMTGIAAKALSDFFVYKPLQKRRVKVYEIYQMLGEVEEEMLEYVQGDVLPLEPESIFFDIKRRGYKPGQLFDGTEVLLPEAFNVEVAENGDWILHRGGAPEQPPLGKMPKNGFYFDMIEDQSLSMDYQPPSIEEVMNDYQKKRPDHAMLEYLCSRSETLRPSGKALLLGMWPQFGPPGVGNTPNWLCLMMTEPDYVRELFERKTELDLSVLEEVKQNIGDGLDIFGIDGTDYGSQKAELFSPELFEQFYFPYYKAVNRWIHENTQWKTWKHSCGSILNLIPYFVKSGLDCINPVQCSAAGMDAESLKKEFGDKITFWGGGVDTQNTLPFGTAGDVYEEVTRRLQIFAPGGGFVFAAVHNIQAKTPPENLEAMFQAVKDFSH
jgi:uroporphyrinogen-III decarboxylase